jgi:hypothetical protein
VSLPNTIASIIIKIRKSKENRGEEWGWHQRSSYPPSKFVGEKKKKKTQNEEINSMEFLKNDSKNEPKLGLMSKKKPHPILSCCNHLRTTFNIKSNLTMVGKKKQQKKLEPKLGLL